MASGKIAKQIRSIPINKRDVFLTVLILVLSLVILYIQNSTEDPQSIEIIVSGIRTGIYDLNDFQQVEINEGTILEIDNGRYRMLRSTCKNQHCVKMGWCTNQPVICVPQEIIVKPVISKGQELLTY